MKILFVTLNGIKNEAFGGAKASIRNFLSLKKYGEVIPYEIKKHSSFASALSGIQGNMPPILDKDIENIHRIIDEQGIDFCFMDSSWLGSVTKCISVPSVTFFHNCESDYNKYVRFGSNESIKKHIYQKLVDKNEELSIKCSKLICTFTDRDSNRLNDLYGRKADIIIPLSIVDQFQKYQIIDEREHCKCVLLFGPAMAANIEGFTWFAKNVSEHLNCQTIIAGKGMDDFKSLGTDKVKVVGYVDSLSDFYNSGDCVVIPLFSGGGMKIKTAEALMFGKYIFGTSEALVGYENIVDPSYMQECNTAEEFIDSINIYLKSKHNIYNESARMAYCNNFSKEATQKKFDEVVNRMLKE